MEKKQQPREMSAEELRSMLKSSIHFKSLGGMKHEGLKLPEEDLKWWRDAKFGMFIHWGLYSILGRGEWVMHNEKIPHEEYGQLADQFMPKHFDASSWAQLAKKAGMKYMVMVARHHDGFSLWNSPGSYNHFTSYHRGAKRDFIKEYIEACRQEELKVGIYYSPMDWRFPGYFKPKELLDNALLMKKQTYDQVEELVGNYGPIDILWYDGAWLAHKGSDTTATWLWEPVKLNQMVRKYNPKTLINPRSGWEGDFYCDEGSHPINGKIVPVPWEKNMCICSGSSWGWIPNDPVTSLKDMITMMVNVFTRDGNLLLNVGPDKDGNIPEEVIERLLEIGGWLEVNGESIYGSRGGPFEPVDGIYGATYKENSIYIHVLDSEAFMQEMLPNIETQIMSCTTLNNDPIPFEQSSKGIKILLPEEVVDPINTIIKLTLKEPVTVEEKEAITFTRR